MYEKALALSFVGLEIVDLFGDITYLVYYPHASLVFVVILCFSLFIPFSFALVIKYKDEGMTGTVLYYFGLAVLNDTTFEPVNRLLIVLSIDFFENLTQMIILHIDSFAVGSRWSAF